MTFWCIDSFLTVCCTVAVEWGHAGEEPEYDEELSYLIKCMEEDIPYMGFFHEIYSCEEPFEYEERDI